MNLHCIGFTGTEVCAKGRKGIGVVQKGSIHANPREQELLTKRPVLTSRRANPGLKQIDLPLKID